MCMKKAWLFLGSVLLLLLFALVRSMSASLAYLCGFGGILLLLVAISFLASPTHVQPTRTRVTVSPPPEPVRPKLSIPLSAQKAHAVFTDKQFELFAAAMIIGGEYLGHTFMRHTGKAGDKGVDVLLNDQFRRRVCAQAKRYRLGNTVKSSQVREFSASIGRYRAHSGYIVTTSALTRDGKDHIADENLRASHGQGGKEMHLIDAHRLDELLRAHPVAIEKA
jgi:hypothetical protein